MAVPHFQFPAENALSIAGQADRLVKALARLDDHESAATAQIELLKRQAGLGDTGHSDEAQELTVSVAAKFEQFDALRRDAEDLLADAMQAEGLNAEDPREPIMASPPPDGDRPLAVALQQLNQWYAKGVVAYLRESSECAKRLLELVPKVDDPDTVILRSGLEALLAEIES